MSSMVPTAAERLPEIAFAPPVPIEALAERAFQLQPPSRYELASVQRPGAAELIDPLLTRVARGKGAIDVALGEGLAALGACDGFIKLGYSRLADYSREVLGISGRTAQAMVQVAQGLRSRPLLAEAVRRGEVSARKAQAVLRAAIGEAEGRWVERAKVETVRALEAAVQEEVRARAGGRARPPEADAGADVSAGADAGAGSGGGAGADVRAGSGVGPGRASGPGAGAGAGASAGPGAPGSALSPPFLDPSQRPLLDPSQEDEWERVVLDVSDDCRPRLMEALALAGRLLGAAAPRWQRFEAICQEYLGVHPEAPDPREKLPPDRPLGAWVGNVWIDGLRPESLGGPVPQWLEPYKAWLEVEMKNWCFLEMLEPVEAPRLGSLGPAEPTDPWRVDAEIRSLGALRERWDEVLGHLAMLFRHAWLWKDAKFASFSHYATERLGMADRTLGQRIWLARKLYDFPALRQAMREGRLSYEKARIVAGCATESTLDAWIAKAERMTCIALRREVEAEDEKQMCARGVLAFFAPRRVGELLAAAFRTVRAGSTRWLLPSECLQALSEHFIETWKHLPRGRSTPQKRAIERDEGWCRVPGCSRPAVQGHHVEFRSHGGSDDEKNLTGLCAVHHHRGVHGGWLRVTGQAPDGLVWEVRRPSGAWVAFGAGAG